MSKNNTPQVLRPIGAKPTPEQLAAERYRAFSQKLESIAQGILYNAVNSAYIETEEARRILVDGALEMAADFIKKAPKVTLDAFKAIVEEAEKESAKE
jgi:hypothetical protein